MVLLYVIHVVNYTKNNLKKKKVGLGVSMMTGVKINWLD